ncbi:MAG: hypothetical protein ACREHD_29605 [Pirellulales bacterium]
MLRAAAQNRYSQYSRHMLALTGSSGEKSENGQVMMRMAGGACVVLLGLGAIGMGIYALVGDEDHINPFRFVRCVIFGVGLIGTGLKFIVG